MDAWQSAKNTALRRAFEARKRLSIPRDEPVNVFDVCHSIGIEVRFVDCKSLEGMYCCAPRTAIILPSTTHRPPGRVAFTCAHELGHHELGHGTRADEYVDGPQHDGNHNPEELGANIFAAHFLMPRQAVVLAVSNRGWNFPTLTSEQAFSLASIFGVGYEAMLWQLSVGLQLLAKSQQTELSRVKPKMIRKSLWEESANTGLVILDTYSSSIKADLEVDDFLITNEATILDTPLLSQVHADKDKRVWRAVEIGSTRIASANADTLIRVSRRGYMGAWRFRYLPEDEE